MELTIDRKPNLRQWEKLNVRPRDHQRFKLLAVKYKITMGELFTACVDALEADLAERQTQEG